MDRDLEITKPHLRIMIPKGNISIHMIDNLGMEKQPRRFSLPEAFFEGSRVFLWEIKAKGVGEEVRGRLSGHGFSTGSEFAVLRQQSSGGSKGDGPLGRRTESEKGRQGAKRPLEGGTGSFPLQRDDVGNERADESHTRALAEFRNAGKNVSGTALRT